MSASVFISGMAVGGVPRLSSSGSVHRSLEPMKKRTMSSVKFVTTFRTPSPNPGTKRSFRVMVSNNQSEQAGNGQGVQVSSVWRRGKLCSVFFCFFVKEAQRYQNYQNNPYILEFDQILLFTFSTQIIKMIQISPLF